VNAELFVNAKAEAYWCAIGHSPGGRVEIETKDEAEKRGQSSPDRAEALVLAYVQVVPREQTVTFGQHWSGRNSP
jgi:hypothetical protein